MVFSGSKIRLGKFMIYRTKCSDYFGPEGVLFTPHCVPTKYDGTHPHSSAHLVIPGDGWFLMPSKKLNDTNKKDTDVLVYNHNETKQEQ